VLPVRLVLNRAFRLALADRDEKERDEIIGELWAPEETEVEASRQRLAQFVDRVAAVQAAATGGEGDTDGTAGPGVRRRNQPRRRPRRVPP
jgi:hypothetical protein